MIPRLPPLLLALIGGASVYGIKYILDKMEPKAIGPPGYNDARARYLQYMRKSTIAAAGAGVLYFGYWLYDKRMHRPIPATSKDTEDRDSFYQDQYRDRDRRLQRENEQWKQSREQRERELRQRLLAEQQALLSQTKDENST